MDIDRFDRLTCIVSHELSRRRLAAALGLVASGTLRFAAARNKKKKRKKLKKNAYGCVNVGGKCRGMDAACCSGICTGKKPKKGQKDKSRCVSHNALNCPAGADACLQGTPVMACGPQNGVCFQTTGQASFCGVPGGDCVACRKDTDCEALGYGAGAACVVCSNCAAAGGTGCSLPVTV